MRQSVRYNPFVLADRRAEEADAQQCNSPLSELICQLHRPRLKRGGWLKHLVALIVLRIDAVRVVSYRLGLRWNADGEGHCHGTQRHDGSCGHNTSHLSDRCTRRHTALLTSRGRYKTTYSCPRQL